MGKSKNEKSDIERFRRMAVVLANHTGVSQASDYFALPAGIRRHYEVMTYTELIRPLVYRDRMERNRSWQQIAVYYKNIGTIRPDNYFNNSTRSAVLSGSGVRTCIHN